MLRESGQIQTERKEENGNFNFEEIEEIEPAMVSLAEQLKENLEAGKYNVLISDDVGGRIPTLILRKLLKKIHPDKAVKTYFVSGGLRLSKIDAENHEKLQKYLKERISDEDSLLIVTQFMFTGRTLIKLSQILNKAGFRDFDIAAAESLPYPELADTLKLRLGSNKLYIGNTNHSKMHEYHEHLAGVRKTKNYSPHPERTDRVFKEEGRILSDDEYREIFGLDIVEKPSVYREKTENPDNLAKYKERLRQPLSEEEKQKIQEDVNLARRDIDLIVEKVIKQVWKKDQASQ